MNCFKQQNSEENPLILLNNANLNGSQPGFVVNQKQNAINLQQQQQLMHLNYNLNEQQLLNQNSDNEMYQTNPGLQMPLMNNNLNNNNNYFPLSQMVIIYINLFC